MPELRENEQKTLLALQKLKGRAPVNQIVENTGLGQGDYIGIFGNPFDEISIKISISPNFEQGGVHVYYQSHDGSMILLGDDLYLLEPESEGEPNENNK